MKIAIGCDHGGIVLKDAVTSTLEALGAEVVDLGTNSTDSVDYPTYGLKVAETVASGQCDAGVISVARASAFQSLQTKCPASDVQLSPTLIWLSSPKTTTTPTSFHWVAESSLLMKQRTLSRHGTPQNTKAAVINVVLI